MWNDIAEMLEREAEGSDSLEVSLPSSLSAPALSFRTDPRSAVGYHVDAFYRGRNWIWTGFLRSRETIRHFPQETHPNLLRLPRCRFRRRRCTTLQLAIDAEKVDRVCGFGSRVG